MNERQMELAEDLDRSFREKALADVRARANVLPPPDWDCKTCYECGDDIIPVERAKLGKWTCLECQDLSERGSQLRRM